MRRLDKSLTSPLKWQVGLTSSLRQLMSLLFVEVQEIMIAPFQESPFRGSFAVF